MKREFLAFLVGALMALGMLLSISAMADVDVCMTGSYYDPATDNGEGVNVEFMPGLTVGYFYTWHKGNRNVYTFTGPNNEDGDVTFYSSFMINGAYNNAIVGEGYVSALDNNTIEMYHHFEYDFLSPWGSIPWCFYVCKAYYELDRITTPVPCGEAQ
jgi:hypothetical protein